VDGVDFEPYLGDLKRHLDRLRKLKARQDSANALRQRCTQEINEEIREGHAVMMRLRSIARAKLGPHNEVLVQFGVAPVRMGTARRRKSSPRPQPEPGEAPPAEPGGGVS
jgi:hypothetical protein